MKPRILTGLISLHLALVAQAADVTSTWTSPASGNWSAASNWTNAPVLGGFPNNGNAGVGTYDAVISIAGSPYTVTLNSDITVEDLTLNSVDATLDHTSGTFIATGALTLSAGTFRLNGGRISNTDINLAGGNFVFSSSGGFLSEGAALNGNLNLTEDSAFVRLESGATFGGAANLSGNFTRLVIEDTQTWTGKTINLDGVGVWLAIDGDHTLTLGAGTLVRGQDTFGAARFIGGANVLLNAAGTIRADLGSPLTINPGSFTNGGTLEAINGSTLTIPNGYTQNAGVTRLDNGTLNTDPGNPVIIAGGRLEGSGTINAPVDNSGTIAPGLSAGSLAITRDLTLASTSALEIEIGGLTSGTEYDLLSEAGTVALTLNGTLSVTLINGFIPQAGQTFTILTSNQNLAGAFSNVAPGERLLTTDGFSSFQVDCGSGDSNVVLTNFIPEPGTGLLLMVGTGLFGFRRHRRQVQSSS